MSEPVRMCECGGRALLEGEVLCPSCQRTHNSLGFQFRGARHKMVAAGHSGASLLGKLAEQARVGAQKVEDAAAPLVREGAELAKSHALPAAKAALGRVEVAGETALRAAIPLAERMIGKARTFLDKKGR